MQLWRQFGVCCLRAKRYMGAFKAAAGEFAENGVGRACLGFGAGYCGEFRRQKAPAKGDRLLRDVMQPFEDKARGMLVDRRGWPG
jgi:hypothetical protein